MLVEKDSAEDKKVPLNTSVTDRKETNDKQCVVVHGPKMTKQI
jgi:hypothetical protein